MFKISAKNRKFRNGLRIPLQVLEVRWSADTMIIGNSFENQPHLHEVVIPDFALFEINSIILSTLIGL